MFNRHKQILEENNENEMKLIESLAVKMLAILMVIVMVFSAVIYWMTIKTFREKSYENYGTIAKNYVKAASGYIDPKTIDKIVAEGGDQTMEYRKLRDELENFYDHSDNIIKYVYVYQIVDQDHDGEKEFRVIYDSDREDGDDYGYVFDMKDDYAKESDTELTKAGNRDMVGPFISNGTWGYLMSVYLPVMNEHRDPAVVIGVDLDMNQVVEDIHGLELKMLGIDAVIFLLLLIAIYYNLGRRVLSPLRKLEIVTTTFKDTKEKNMDPANEVKTGDEFERLYHAIRETEDVIISDRIKLEEYLEKISQMAYRDELTGVKRPNAYEQEVMVLEQMIDSENAEFAIVMADMNGLKSVNDKYGHSKGDEALKAMSYAICSRFKHSPVFRVGGDEFVVILRDKDYQRRELLLGQLRGYEVKRDMSVEEPWKQVAMSIGTATFDPTRHTRVKDVLDEADAQMYEHKKNLGGRV